MKRTYRSRRVALRFFVDTLPFVKPLFTVNNQHSPKMVCYPARCGVVLFIALSLTCLRLLTLQGGSPATSETGHLKKNTRDT